MPPLPPNGLRPPVQEPPVRREIPEMSFYDPCKQDWLHVNRWLMIYDACLF
jgi:hypothetical protein